MRVSNFSHTCTQKIVKFSHVLKQRLTHRLSMVDMMGLSLSKSTLMNVTAGHDRQGQAAHRRAVESRIVVEFASGKDHA